MGSMFSSSSKEEIDTALSKVKDIVSSTPVVVFRAFELFGAFKNHPWNVHEHLILMPQHSTSSIDEFNATEFKTYCQYCKRVKQLLLSQLGASYKVIELDEESDGSEIQSALEQWTGQRTVPNVFIGGKHVGGCDEKHRGGKLVTLLMDAGAIANNSAQL